MSKTLTFGDLSEAAFEKFWRYSKNVGNILSIRRRLSVAFGDDTPVTKLTTLSIERVCTQWLSEGASEKTCNRRLSCLSKMLKWAERTGRIDRAPYIERFTEGLGRLRYATEEEVGQVIAHLDLMGRTDEIDLVMLLADTGMRRSEVLDMKWEQWNPDCQFIELNETKNGRSRKVPLTERAQGVLENRYRFAPEEPEYPHLNLFGPFKWVSRSTFAVYWNKARAEMGLGEDKGFTPHSLRHGFACRLLQRGARIEVVSRLLGHDDIRTTINRYYHESPGDTASTVALLEPENHA